jgi:multicomponent Na+:H+ antiporter subunit F
MIVRVAGFVMFVGAIAIIACMYRVWRGPTAVDRVLALDLIGMWTLALIAVGSLFSSVFFYSDALLLIGLIVYVGTIASARYIERTTAKRGDHG